MPYITSVERIGIEKGIQQGMQQWESALLERQLTRRFASARTARRHCNGAAARSRGRSVHSWKSPLTKLASSPP